MSALRWPRQSSSENAILNGIVRCRERPARCLAQTVLGFVRLRILALVGNKLLERYFEAPHIHAGTLEMIHPSQEQDMAFMKPTSEALKIIERQAHVHAR